MNKLFYLVKNEWSIFGVIGHLIETIYLLLNDILAE